MHANIHLMTITVPVLSLYLPIVIFAIDDNLHTLTHRHFAQLPVHSLWHMTQRPPDQTAVLQPTSRSSMTLPLSCQHFLFNYIFSATHLGGVAAVTVQALLQLQHDKPTAALLSKFFIFPFVCVCLSIYYVVYHNDRRAN